jgi:crotonobetainyl-CoA:carnitine CoA-transferase CaiB-like acyl-CoA transferase
MYRFSAFGEVPRARAPKLGEHTAAVLSDIAAPESQKSPETVR